MNRRRSHVLYTPGYRRDEILLEPDAEELGALRRWKKAWHDLNKLLMKEHQWAEQDRAHDEFMDAQRRKFAERLQGRVASDMRAAELQAARDAEIEKVKSYYVGELKKEIAAADKRRKEALEAITKRIQRDNLRVEREELTRRGIVRGLRGFYRGR